MGFCTLAGGASSHVAILARSLDIPAVAGIEPRALDIADGTLVILDGAKGTLRMNVTEDDVARIRRRQERLAARRAEELTHADEPAVTGDGHHVEVVANIGGLEDAQEAMTKGAEGVGLLRSEFVFLDRAKAPTEDEQAEIYTAIAKALAPGQPLVIRTLDVGGDKPLPYLPMAPEENPFLGERGIRRRAGPARGAAHPGPGDPPGGRRRREDQRDVPDDRHHRGLPAGQGDLRGGAGGPRSRARAGGDHGRGAVRGRHGAAVRRRGGLLLGGDERPDPVHPGHGPRPPQAGAAGGRPQPGRARAHRAGREGRARGWPVGRGLRRHGVRPPGRADPARARRRRAERQHPRDPGRQGPDPSLSLARCQELAARALTQDSAAAVRALVPAYDDEE